MSKQTTITEALREVKTIAKRIETKGEFIARYLLRQESMKDPLERQGGSGPLIEAERQAVNDLYTLQIAIRSAIRVANAANEVTLNGTTRSIADWLVWKREVAPKQQLFLRGIANVIEQNRTRAVQRGMAVVQAAQSQDAKPTDIVVNINEQELARQIEELETILGDLDGQLSLKNATLTIEY